MIDFVVGLICVVGLIIGIAGSVIVLFWGAYHLYPTKKDVRCIFPRGKTTKGE